MSTRRRIDAGFAAALLILLLVSLAAIGSIREQRANQERLIRSEERLRTLELVLSDLKDAETGQRGYLLTRDPAYLAPYHDAIDSIGVDLAGLRRLTADDPAQGAGVERLAALSARRLAVLDRTVRLEERGESEAALAIVRQATGKEIMDTIRVVQDRMEAEEMRRREQREAELERSSTRTTWVAVLGSLVALVVSGVARFLIHRDLRARAAAEAALTGSERRYRALVENASDLIYTADTAGRFTYVNPVAVRATGYAEEDLLGLHYAELIREDHRASTAEFYRRQVEEGREISYLDFPILTRDGRELWIGQNVQLLREGERISGVQAVARDITRQRETERMKDEFLSIVSHELRTPLTAIRGSLGLLASGKLGTLEERGQRMLEIAEQNTDRLVRLINDLLDIEKIESGKVTMERRAVDAAALAREAVETMAPMAERAGVTLAVHVEAAEVWADPDRILQVLDNLLSNAIKFSAAGGEVAVEMERRAGEVEFRVRDHGRGIPADKLETVFERFAQVDSSDSRQKGGTGLGLPIARSIVQQHRGQLWVESRWGEGSTFHFTLPVQEGTATAAPGEPLVLVCDDDAGLTAAVRSVLEQSGYRVLTARDGEDALELARRERPAAVLLDLAMPGIGGDGVLARIRGDERLRDVPVVIFSALEPGAEGVLAHAVEWLRKPADASELVGAVRRAVGRADGHHDVLMVEDDDGIANVVAEIFASHGVSMTRARSGAEAIEMSLRTTYDLLVLDLGLPDTDGFAVVEWLRRHDRLREVPLLVYTARDLTEADRSRLRLGPTEFLIKGRSPLEQFEQRAVEMLGDILTRRGTRS